MSDWYVWRSSRPSRRVIARDVRRAYDAWAQVGHKLATKKDPTPAFGECEYQEIVPATEKRA